MSDKLLIRGGTVLSMDRAIGDLPRADVLIDGDTIAAVQTDISADAETVDATGFIVLPGFVDTHRHTWEAAIRGSAPNATLDDYFVEILDTFAPLYRPEDVYASNLAGALECLNAGITTLVDWSHINNSPEHPDAAIRALQETGIRAQYAYGSANTSLADYWYESKIAIPPDDVRRIRDTYFAGDGGLLTMALATRGTGLCQDDVVRAEWTQLLEIATVNGAHVAGVEHRTGSLTPGKRADVILIDARQLNVAPVIDPVAAVALCADVSNVDTVVVDGVVRKRNGRLLADVDRARRLVEESSGYLVAEAARRKKP